jgi:hypothetical protein
LFLIAWLGRGLALGVTGLLLFIGRLFLTGL